MSGWPFVKLGSVVSLVMGQAPAASDCNKDGVGTPFVKVGEFGLETPIVQEWTTDPKKFARSTDVLICVVGATCGKINLGIDCAIGRSAAAIRPKQGQLDQRYLWYFMQGKVGEMRSGSQGAAQTVINREMINDVVIPLPPLEEQRRIVAVLDEAFAAIATASANAEKNLAKAIQLPAVHLAGMLENVDNLEVISIDEVAFIQEGPGIRKYEYQDDGYPMINVRCVQDGWIDLSKGRAAKTELATGKWRHFQVEEGDILFTTSGTIGRCAVVQNHDLPLLMNTSVVRFRSNTDRLLQRYLYHFLRSDLFQQPLAKLVSGTAIANVGPTHIKTLSIAIPSLGDQDRITAGLDAMIEATMELRAVFERKRDALASLKQSLLHSAFTGELTAAMPEAVAA